MIRVFREEDAPALAEVYRDAVQTLGPQAYSREQVEAWASWPDDIAEFTAHVSRGLTLLTEFENRIVAFGQLNPLHHLALLYCRGYTSRQGLCS